MKDGIPSRRWIAHFALASLATTTLAAAEPAGEAFSILIGLALDWPRD